MTMHNQTCLQKNLTKHKSTKLRIMMESTIAVAASIALLLILHMNISKTNPATINDVDQAFCQLSTEDQT